MSQSAITVFTVANQNGTSAGGATIPKSYSYCRSMDKNRSPKYISGISICRDNKIYWLGFHYLTSISGFIMSRISALPLAFLFSTGFQLTRGCFEDQKICPDGMVLNRDPDLNCTFPDCLEILRDDETVRNYYRSARSYENLMLMCCPVLDGC